MLLTGSGSRHHFIGLLAGTVSVMTAFHDLEMTSITGDQVSFDDYSGKLALVVNVASA
jgi:hypothetical protein